MFPGQQKRSLKAQLVQYLAGLGPDYASRDKASSLLRSRLPDEQVELADLSAPRL